jgi:hypothetical protein
MQRSLACFVALNAFASLTLLPGCVQDESAPNRLGLERPALLPADSRAAESANKRALEKPQRDNPTSGTEFPGQSRLTSVPGQVLTLDDAPATQPAAMPVEISPATSRAPVPEFKIDDTKNLAAPGHDIPVPGTTELIDKTWGQVYPLPTYPHRDWAPTVSIYQTGSTPGNPWYFENIWDRPDYQPNHPYGTGAKIGADALEIPYAVGEMFALPILMLIDCPFEQKSTAYPSMDPNYNRYLPVTTNLVPAPYPGTFQFEAATQPTTAPAGDQSTISRDLPLVPVKP